MKQTKKLKREHKEFLSGLGLKSKDYRFIDEDANSYTFWNRKTEKIEVVRR